MKIQLIQNQVEIGSTFAMYCVNVKWKSKVCGIERNQSPLKFNFSFVVQFLVSLGGLIDWLWIGWEDWRRTCFWMGFWNLVKLMRIWRKFFWSNFGGLIFNANLNLTEISLPFKLSKFSFFKLSKFSISNCQNFPFQTVKKFPFQTVKIFIFQTVKIFLFQTVKIFLFKLSKFSFSNCQNFLFQTVKISLFQTVKISFSKLSKFSFPNCQNPSICWFISGSKDQMLDQPFSAYSWSDPGWLRIRASNSSSILAILWQSQLTPTKHEHQ